MGEMLTAELAENLTEFCENRGRVYGLLARCFEREVDASFAAELAGAAPLAADDGALVDGFARMQRAVAGCDGDEAALERLAVAFNRVFFGMGPRTAQKAFPYESVYTSDKGLMMQDAYSQVKAVYREAGFAKNPAFTEPEDHLAVELAFMAELCARAGAALAAGDAAAAEASLVQQRDFVEAHLLNWIDRFAADAAAADPGEAGEGGFYAHAARFAQRFAAADAAALQDVLA